MKKLENDINILTPDGAWCWFADPRAIFHKGTGKTAVKAYYPYKKFLSLPL